VASPLAHSWLLNRTHYLRAAASGRRGARHRESAAKSSTPALPSPARNRRGGTFSHPGAVRLAGGRRILPGVVGVREAEAGARSRPDPAAERGSQGHPGEAIGRESLAARPRRPAPAAIPGLDSALPPEGPDPRGLNRRPQELPGRRQEPPRPATCSALTGFSHPASPPVSRRVVFNG
jgi:hypothetical protein